MESLLSNFDHFPPSSLNVTESVEVLVRSARIEDINGIGEVLTSSFNQFNSFTLWIYPLLKFNVCEDVRQRWQSDDNYWCIIAEKKNAHSTDCRNKIIGTVELSFKKLHGFGCRTKMPYIANLAVNESYRRQGIASQLLLKCEQIAKSNGFERVYLHVLAENKMAQKLYSHNGYTIEQVETDLYSLFVPSKRRLLFVKSIQS